MEGCSPLSRALLTISRAHFAVKQRNEELEWLGIDEAADKIPTYLACSGTHRQRFLSHKGIWTAWQGVVNREEKEVERESSAGKY